MAIILLSVSFVCAVLLFLSFGAKRTRLEAESDPDTSTPPEMAPVPLEPLTSMEKIEEIEGQATGWSYSSKDEALLHYDMALHASKYGYFEQVRNRLKVTFSINPKFRPIALADPALAEFWEYQNTGGL